MSLLPPAIMSGIPSPLVSGHLNVVGEVGIIAAREEFGRGGAAA
jgi:hypothetical protein